MRTYKNKTIDCTESFDDCEFIEVVFTGNPTLYFCYIENSTFLGVKTCTLERCISKNNIIKDSNVDIHFNYTTFNNLTVQNSVLNAISLFYSQFTDILFDNSSMFGTNEQNIANHFQGGITNVICRCITLKNSLFENAVISGCIFESCVSHETKSVDSICLQTTCINTVCVPEKPSEC